MSPLKYAKYIIQDVKEPFGPEAEKMYATFARRIMWIDREMVPGAFQMNTAWYLKKLDRGPGEHVHDSDEILGFFGNDPDDPYNLHGEVEFWVGGQKQIITRSTMVSIPAGMRHCPLILRRVDRPILHFSVVTEGQWITKQPETENDPAYDYSKHVVNTLQMPEEKKKIHSDYIKYATRILWLDKDVVPGAFHMNTAWFWKAGPTLENVPHTHTSDELIAFLSNDAENPHDLGGEVEIWLEDEKHTISKSCLIFIPAGMKHCPLILKKVGRPIFHFTVVPSSRYIKDDKPE
jgi:quercetin dioxygenase-like cupin family protein